MAGIPPQDRLGALLQKAENFRPPADRRRPKVQYLCSMHTVQYLYRCKASEHFQTILNNGGIMTPTLKDTGGDPQCPINGNLKGTFFGVTLFNRRLPDKSPYGNTMMLVPLQELFTENTNLYFADFYCMQGFSENHYITLVLTQQDTEEDLLCSQLLRRLDPGNNKFLTRQLSSSPPDPSGNNGPDVYNTIAKSTLYLEVLYTHDVNITGRPRHPVGVLGSGVLRGNVAKRPECTDCNV